MISLKIKNIGSFMSGLLSSDCFDSFLLEEAVIKMSCTFEINGHLNRDFDSSDEMPSYSFIPWSDVRGKCREIIKGQKAPSAFRFTLWLKPEYIEDTLKKVDDPSVISGIKGLAVNIRQSGTGLHIVTGVAAGSFLLDKSADRIWDETMRKFLSSKNIEYDENE